MERYTGKFLVPFVGKRPALRDWPHKASADSRQHKEWFGPYRPAILTGAENKLVVVDVDDGIEELRRLYLSIFPRPPTVVLSNRGGHVYFEHPGYPVKNAVGAIVNGVKVDIRGEHGCALVPGNGNPHRWAAKGLEFDPDKKLPRFDALRIERKQANVASEPPQAIHDLRKLIYSVRAIEGQGGDRAAWYVVNRLKDAGCTEVEALAILVEWNSVNCEPPFTTNQLLHKVRYCYQKGA